MPILDELKKKANGKADSANNIAEAIAQMDFSEGSVTPGEIAESVSAYLDEHLTNPTNPPIDTSLTIAGAAADSKETGDEIGALKEGLNALESDVIGINEYMNDDVEITRNKFVNDSGVIVTNTGSCYTSEIALTSGKYYMIYTKTETAGTTRVHGYKNGVWVSMLYKLAAPVTNEVVELDIDNSEIDAIQISYYYVNTDIISITNYDPDSESIIPTLKQLNANVDNLNHLYEQTSNIYPTWVGGGINAANGATTSTAYCVRTDTWIYTEDGLSIECDDPTHFNFRVAKYNNTSYVSFVSSYANNDGNINGGEYVRIWITNINHDVPISPEQYGERIKIQIKKAVSTVVDNSRYDHSPFKCSPSDFDGWYYCLTTDDEFASYNFSRNKSYASTIALYDTLVDNVYVTKNLLATINITGIGDVPIYEYIFKPLEYTGAPLTGTGKDLFRRTPKILLDGSMHGFEKGSTFGNFLFLYDLVHNWKSNKVLTNIRNFVEIRCIPISNPYGFENNTYSNENDVNINRNFPSSTWKYEEAGAQGSGEVAGDQPETQMIMKWVWDNYDALMYLCMHTNGQYYTSSYAEMNACLYPSNEWGDAYTHRAYNVINKFIEKENLFFPEYHNIIPSSRIGQYQPTSTDSKGGTVDTWALEKASVNSMTLEGINGLKLSSDSDSNPTIPLFSKNAITFDAEITGNFIATLLSEYCIQ